MNNLQICKVRKCKFWQKLVNILGAPLFVPLQLAKNWFQAKDYFGHPAGRPTDSHYTYNSALTKEQLLYKHGLISFA